MEKQNFMRRLLKDESGITVVEFGIVAPTLILMMIGMFDFGHQIYATAVLQGTLQNSARSATLENGFDLQDQIDADLESNFQTVIPVGSVDVTRRNFASFTDIVTPEEFTDTNGDGVCNDGEPFEDVNGNANWDQDRGRDGLGGARDAVLFTATATYDRMFPLAGLLGIPEDVTIVATTVLRNQPYNEQGVREPVVENCT
ncbi:MAG: TadE/TadG family type IV pilus assembly protein [Erythrobacter sp.]